MWHGLSIQILLSVLFVITLAILQYAGMSFANRFLSIKLTILFLAPQVIGFLINALSIYLRAFKKEPFMWIQIVNAGLVVLAVFIVLKNQMGLELFLYVLVFINWIIVLPLSLMLFKKKRVEFLTVGNTP